MSEYTCPVCGEEVGMMGHGPSPCLGKLSPKATEKGRLRVRVYELEEREARTGWLTRDECIDKYNFDPTGIPEEKLPSKLTRVNRHLQRVWREDKVKESSHDDRG
jgi:hypothetical protein